MTTQDSTAAATAECLDCSGSQQSWELSRRRLLAGTAAAGAAIAISDHMTVRSASAATAARADTLVVLSFRGGMDGLSAVVPVTDPDYYKARPRVAIPASATLKLDARFGLHPSLKALMPLWQSSKLAIVHATGMMNPTRSHFVDMENMERAAIGSGVRTGWLDRAIGLGSVAREEPFRSISIGEKAPYAVFGPEPSVTMRSLSQFRLKPMVNAAARDRWSTALSQLHRTATSAVVEPARAALGGLAAAAELSAIPYTAGAKYPESPLGISLREAARLIKLPRPVSAITIDVGNWDMHADLGTVASGSMTDQLRDVGDSLAAFATDLGPALANVTVVTMSEFGRRTAENGSGGTDHGWGNAMFILGGGVNGGTSVKGSWPGLAPDKLYQGDLEATTDYRSVLADILINRCGATSARAQAIFPDWKGSPLGLTKPRT